MDFIRNLIDVVLSSRQEPASAQNHAMLHALSVASAHLQGLGQADVRQLRAGTAWQGKQEVLTWDLTGVYSMAMNQKNYCQRSTQVLRPQSPEPSWDEMAPLKSACLLRGSTC
jgi:hypothetical protein